MPVLPQVAEDGGREGLAPESHRAHRHVLVADLLHAEFGRRAGGDQPGVDPVAEQRTARGCLRIDGHGEFPGQDLGGLGHGAQRGTVEHGEGDAVGGVPQPLRGLGADAPGEPLGCLVLGELAAFGEELVVRQLVPGVPGKQLREPGRLGGQQFVEAPRLLHRGVQCHRADAVVGLLGRAVEFGGEVFLQYGVGGRRDVGAVVAVGPGEHVTRFGGGQQDRVRLLLAEQFAEPVEAGLVGQSGDGGFQRVAVALADLGVVQRVQIGARVEPGDLTAGQVVQQGQGGVGAAGAGLSEQHQEPSGP